MIFVPLERVCAASIQNPGSSCRGPLPEIMIHWLLGLTETETA